MAYRSSERRDGSVYHYPVTPAAGGYAPQSLEALRVPALPTAASRGSYLVKFYYDSDWFPSEVVKASAFPQVERESIEHAKEVRRHKELKIIGVEVIEPVSKKIISAEGITEKHAGEVADLGEDFEVEE